MATFTDMTVWDLQRLPRHPDWKYELVDGELLLSHRPSSIDLVRSTALPVKGESGPEVDLLDIQSDEAAVWQFLLATWQGEEPYCYMDPTEVESIIGEAIGRSWDRLTSPSGVCVRDDDGMAGVLLLTEPHRYSDRTNPVITWLTVRYEVRMTGIASAMLATTVSALRAAGVEGVDSGTSPANRASIQWHWRHGFTPLPDPLAGTRSRPFSR